MKTVDLKEELSFDDVLILPNYSEVIPDSVDLSSQLSPDIVLKIPIISASMDTVSEYNMAAAMYQNGGIAALHKNLSVSEQSAMVKKIKQEKMQVFASIGTRQGAVARTEALLQEGIDGVVIDTAHAHSKNVLSTIESIKKRWDILLIAGNIGTQQAAQQLIDYGADILKVGLGPGSICTTRIVTGVGVPQLSAIDHVSFIAKKYKIPVIADGGIRNSGDIAKAIVAGANAVMLGSLLAGTDEAPTVTKIIDGKKMKYYRGMGSAPAMKLGGHDRYFKENSIKQAEEGIEAYTQYRGAVKDVLLDLAAGLKSSFGYMGCKNIQAVQKKGKFIKITPAGSLESNAHSVKKK